MEKIKEGLQLNKIKSCNPLLKSHIPEEKHILWAKNAIDAWYKKDEIQQAQKIKKMEKTN